MFSKGLDKYFVGDWETAREIFEKTHVFYFINKILLFPLGYASVLQGWTVKYSFGGN
jgi:hypothetical protein